MMKQLIPFPKEDRAPLLCCSHGKSQCNLEGKRNHPMYTEQASSPMKSLGWCWGSKGAIPSRCPGCRSSPVLAALCFHSPVQTLCKHSLPKLVTGCSSARAMAVQYEQWTAPPASCRYLKHLPGCCAVLLAPGCPGPDLERPGHVLNHCQQIWIPFALYFVALSHATDARKMTSSQKISPCFLSQVPTAQLRSEVWVLTTSLTAASVQTCYRTPG